MAYISLDKLFYSDRTGLLKLVRYKNEKCYGIDLALIKQLAGTDLGQ